MYHEFYKVVFKRLTCSRVVFTFSNTKKISIKHQAHFFVLKEKIGLLIILFEFSFTRKQNAHDAVNHEPWIMYNFLDLPAEFLWIFFFNSLFQLVQTSIRRFFLLTARKAEKNYWESCWKYLIKWDISLHFFRIRPNLNTNVFWTLEVSTPPGDSLKSY